MSRGRRNMETKSKSEKKKSRKTKPLGRNHTRRALERATGQRKMKTAYRANHW